MKTTTRFLSLFLFFLVLLGAQMLQAQTGDIRGFVYDKATGEPLTGASIGIMGTKNAAATDIEGFYALAKVPIGVQTLVAYFVGYDSLQVTVQVKGGEILNQKIYLSEKSLELKTVEVSAERDAAQTEVRTSTVQLTAKQITKLPSIGGEPDIAQYLQVLPGIVSTGDQGGQLYIRGGSLIQTKVLLDGMTVYNPFHSVGLFSIFETDVIRNVEVMTGGFPADYGGRISAVVDITTRDGNKKRHCGKIGGNTFLSKLILEGPLSKLKDDSKGFTGSYIITAKNSYLNKTSPVLYEYVDSLGLPYSFTDLYGKLNFTSETGSKFNLSAYSSSDKALFQQTSAFDWQAWGAGGKFVIVPGQTKFIIDGAFSYSNYALTLAEADGKPRNSSIGGFNGGVNFSYYYPNADLKYGIELGGFSTKFRYYTPFGVSLDEDQNTTEIATFVRYKVLLANKRLVLEPGIRFSYFASLPASMLEPRLGLKYNLTPKVRLKASGGVYAQNFISTKSDRDIVNLFTGFLSSPEGQIKNTTGEYIRNPLQISTHAIGGIEMDLAKRWTLTVEGYLKRFNQLVNLNRSKVLNTDPNWIVETGDATGVDFLTQYDSKHWNVWVAYSLAFNSRYDGTITYSPHFDRRHNVNLLTTYTFGKDMSWEMSVRWNLGSGFPFTQTQGFYEEIGFGTGVDTDYLNNNGQIGVIYSDDYNGGRLPYYHRLDFSAKKKITFGRYTSLDLTTSVTNVYNRQNIFYFDRLRYQRVNQLPIIPSLGVLFSF